MSIYKPKMGLSKQIDDIIIERNELEAELAETLLNRDIAEDLANELKNGRNGLQIEVDNLAEENGHFANFLERMNYTPCEIDNIANGWFTDRITDEGSQALLDSNIELRADIRKLRSKLTKIENICNDTNEEN